MRKWLKLPLYLKLILIILPSYLASIPAHLNDPKKLSSVNLTDLIFAHMEGIFLAREFASFDFIAKLGDIIINKDSSGHNISWHALVEKDKDLAYLVSQVLAHHNQSQLQYQWLVLLILWLFHGLIHEERIPKALRKRQFPAFALPVHGLDGLH